MSVEEDKLVYGVLTNDLGLIWVPMSKSVNLTKQVFIEPFPPGEYELKTDTWLSESFDGVKVKELLKKGLRINLVETKEVPKLIRGRIKDPRGWINLQNIDEYDPELGFKFVNLRVMKSRHNEQNSSISNWEPTPRKVLIIGNSSYENWQSLDGCQENLDNLSDVFRTLGFTVVRARLDCTTEKMKKYLQQFFKEIVFNDDVAIYYTGHGMFHNDTTFLVPIDAPHPKKNNRKQHNEKLHKSSLDPA